VISCVEWYCVDRPPAELLGVAGAWGVSYGNRLSWLVECLRFRLKDVHPRLHAIVEPRMGILLRGLTLQACSPRELRQIPVQDYIRNYTDKLDPPLRTRPEGWERNDRAFIKAWNIACRCALEGTNRHALCDAFGVEFLGYLSWGKPDELRKAMLVSFPWAILRDLGQRSGKSFTDFPQAVAWQAALRLTRGSPAGFGPPVDELTQWLQDELTGAGKYLELATAEQVLTLGTQLIQQGQLNLVGETVAPLLEEMMRLVPNPTMEVSETLLATIPDEPGSKVAIATGMELGSQHHYVMIRELTTTRTFTLPSSFPEGGRVTYSDETGLLTPFVHIIIRPPSGTFNGQEDYRMKGNYGSATFMYANGAWHIWS
jgi:hypothetical protein